MTYVDNASIVSIMVYAQYMHSCAIMSNTSFTSRVSRILSCSQCDATQVRPPEINMSHPTTSSHIHLIVLDPKPTARAPKRDLHRQPIIRGSTSPTHPARRRRGPYYPSATTDDQPQSPRTYSTHLYAVQSLRP